MVYFPPTEASPVIVRGGRRVRICEVLPRSSSTRLYVVGRPSLPVACWWSRGRQLGTVKRSGWLCLHTLSLSLAYIQNKSIKCSVCVHVFVHVLVQVAPPCLYTAKGTQTAKKLVLSEMLPCSTNPLA